MVAIPSFCSVQMSSYQEPSAPSPRGLGSVQTLLLAIFQEIIMDKLRGRVRAGSRFSCLHSGGWKRPHWCPAEGADTPPGSGQAPKAPHSPGVSAAFGAQPDSSASVREKGPEEKRTLSPGDSGCLSSECPGWKGRAPGPLPSSPLCPCPAGDRGHSDFNGSRPSQQHFGLRIQKEGYQEM